MVACWAGHLPLVTWLAPESLSAQVLLRSGSIAPFFMLVLALCSGIALLDILVNDLFPKRFHLPTLGARHIGYMAMAISLLMLSGIVASRVGLSAILISYLLAATFSAGIAGLDLKARHERTPA